MEVAKILTKLWTTLMVFNQDVTKNKPANAAFNRPTTVLALAHSRPATTTGAYTYLTARSELQRIRRA